MHILLALAVAGLQIANAQSPPKARVTQAPAVPKVFRRQEATCPDGGWTACPDGFGCCEIGAPCSTFLGEPVCDTDCNGAPCGDFGCCDLGFICTSTLGNPICATEFGFGGLDDFTTMPFPTITFDEEPSFTTSDPIIPTSTFTSSNTPDESETTSTPEETSEDLPTIPLPTATGSGDDDSTSFPPDSDDDNDSSNSGDFTNEPGESSGDGPIAGGGDGGDGAGMISVKGSMALLILALVGGAFVLQ
ncbi:hypothetical protein BJX61DRAFT_545794 [Aspergillus egyptiacus]|nr:hypothetical protein BJX61DRAFT_545794 [Aspergillus egyptiacus]